MGAEYSARTSPFGVIATMAPRTPAGQMLSMKRWRSRSIVVTMGFPGVGWQRGGCRFLPHQTAPGVHLDVAYALVAPQGVVVLPLQSGLPHDRSQHGTGIPVGGQIGFGHLGDVSDQVGHRLSGRVQPLRLGLDHQPRQRGAMLLQLGDGLERRVAEDQRRLIARLRVAVDDVAHLTAVERHEPSHPGEHRPEGVRGRSEQLDGIAGHVLGDDPARCGRGSCRGAG